MIVIEDFDMLRAALAAMCGELTGVPEEVVFDSKLVANELLSNVLQHGGGRAYFSYEREGNEIKITVRGEQAFRPPERSRCADVNAERGRGLFLVDTLTERRVYSEQEGVSVIIVIRK